MLLEHERNYGLGMDALVTVSSWNTNGSMIWAWMLWSPYALGTRTELWFGHGCSGHRMLLEHERNYSLGLDALVTVCSWNTNGIMVWAWMLWSAYALGTLTGLWFGHGCSSQRMLWEHERRYGRLPVEPGHLAQVEPIVGNPQSLEEPSRAPENEDLTRPVEGLGFRVVAWYSLNSLKGGYKGDYMGLGV